MLKIAIFLIGILCFTSVQVAFALDGTQRVSLTNPRLVNSLNEVVSQNINTNQQIQVSADVVNKQGDDQSFVYIVQILDESQKTYKLTWFVASLGPQQKFSPAISWSTQRPGTYVAEIYVWDSIKNASALCPMTQMKIVVS